MKKIYLISIVTTLSLLIFWCSIKNQSTNWNEITTGETTWDIADNLTYESKTNNYSFNFPQNREFKENQYWFEVVIFSPQDDDIKENVWITTQQLQKFLSTQEYYEETLDELEKSLIWFKEIKSEDINISWIQWKSIIYTHQTWKEKVEIKSKQSFLISSSNIVYSINYTATKWTYKDFLDWANTILESFKINEN